MNNKEYLTNERLNKLFDSPFNLVNYAIKQAKIKMAKGDIRTSNVAIEALELLDREGVQDLSEDVSMLSSASRHTEKKKDASVPYKRKGLSSYSWSDVK